MQKKYGRLKILCVAIAVLATLLLSSLRTGDPGAYEGAAFTDKAGDAQTAVGPDAPQNGESGGSGLVDDTRVDNTEDIDRWDSPVKDVFRSEGITVRSLELLKDGTYPIFGVTLPFGLTVENENRFTDMIGKIAKANSWRDFEFVDLMSGARVKVMCDRQFDMVDEVIIDGDRNYFVRLAQKKAVEEYSFVRAQDIERDGRLLRLLREGGWKRGLLSGEPGGSDGSFDGYDIYFDSGIRVKYSGDRIYNIVFDSRCKSAVLKGIDFEDGRRQVVRLLGTPQFEDEKKELYGYKAADFYIFFTGTEKLREISVYSRNTGYDREALMKLLAEYGGEPDEVDLDRLVNELKSLWPEYDEYYNERGALGVSYDSIGLSADNMFEDRGGPYITVYGNFEGAVDPALELPDKAEGLGEYSNDILLLRLDIDRIFEAEKGRLERAGYLNARRQEEGTVSPDGSMRVLDNEGDTYEHAGLYVLSVSGGKPDIELHTGNYTGRVIWLDNRHFIYDVFSQGIFIYDTQGKETLEVLSSDPEKDADYELVSYEAGKITIVNAVDGRRLIKECTFDADGTVTVK